MAADESTTENNEEKTKQNNNLDKNIVNNQSNLAVGKMEIYEKPLTIIKRCKYWISLITVEPILALYVMPSVLGALATQNLYLEKACRVNLNFADHVCDALTIRNTANYTVEEAAVQKLVAQVSGWKTVLQSFLPCVMILFLGAWSDRTGRRKVCMLMPIIGEIFTSIGLMVNTYFFYELPIEVTAVTEAIFPALTGGWFTMFMGIFSYIADITTVEERTLRIGVVNMFYTLGVPVGSALSGILLKKIGFYGIFAASGTMYIISFAYGLIRIKEERKPIENQDTTYKGWLQSFFDVRNVKETVLVAFRKGPHYRRLRVSVLLINVCVIIGPIYGEMSVMYLFTRYRFNWDEVDFSIFSTYSVCTGLFGTLFSVGVFSHILKMDDAIVGVISSTSKFLGAFMYAFSSTTWHIYIAPLVEILSSAAFISLRSMISKAVASDELGKVNSLMAVGEAMMPLVYAPMYTSLYSATLATFPGAFFLMGGALTSLAIIIFAWLYALSLRQKRLEKNAEDKDGVPNGGFISEEKSTTPSIGFKSPENDDLNLKLTIEETNNITNLTYSPRDGEKVYVQTIKINDSNGCDNDGFVSDDNSNKDCKKNG